MKTRHFLLFTPLLLTTALSAQSAPPAITVDIPDIQPAVARAFGPLLRALDTDRDGTLSQDELRLAPIALTAFDLDDDGFLLRDEIGSGSMVHSRRAAFRVTFARAPRPSADSTLMLVLDANHDGIIQPIEVANAGSSLRRLDTNGDGAIMPDELRRAGAAPRAPAGDV